ncbi:hypothetical protein GGQ64_005379 [Rhizobium azooxidifex]|uniref:DUF2815 family protein n=1 Tax=Mycoplana azooxidifex TaxID=1636188 RepID=A0A7W6GM66_9HYPH|nr:ssDNA-binding protein [Mycoplana azooxidifex]MBB3980132.1 hypothetical protein [Mycoplana azooxidifex]
MSDVLMKAFKSEKSGNIITCQLRMMYANLITPGFPSKKERDPKKKQWGATGLVPAKANIDVLREAIDEVIDANLTAAQKAKAKIVMPIKETAADSSLAIYADEFPYFLRMNTKCFDRQGKPRPAPEVVYAKNGAPVQEADEADELYNGRWFRSSLNPYWYDNENIGVSLGLVNVQLLKHDEPLAGGKVKADREFEPVEGLEDLEDEGAAFE